MEISRRQPLGRRESILLGATGIALALTSGLVAYDGGGTGDATRQALAVGAPIGVGIYAWRRPQNLGFGPLMLLVGIAWFVAGLSASDVPVLYSSGRVGAWTAETVLACVILAFPSGRLQERADRVLALFAVALFALLYLPTALLMTSFPVPGPSSLCASGCPDNAFALVARDPGWVAAVLVPVREGLTLLLGCAIVARLGVRAARATPLLRRTLLPLLIVAIVRFVALGAFITLRPVDASLSATLSEMLLAGVALIAGAFLLGLLIWRIHVAERLQGLAAQIGTQGDEPRLSEAIGRALGDPAAAQLLAGSEDWRCAHDDLPAEQREYVAAVAALAMLRLSNDQLHRRVELSARELAESRAELGMTAVAARSRVQRDLHDGAQQRLIALRIRLALAAEQPRHDPDELARELAYLGRQLDEALVELRELAAGHVPPVLTEHGLERALAAACAGSPVPVAVLAALDGRYAPPVERAVYFTCLEAIQNALKHAAGAGRVTVWLSDDEGLSFAVADDGAGFDLAAAAGGAGLASMRQRLAALGGVLAIETAPGAGTRVAGHVPAARAQVKMISPPAASS